MQRTKFKSELKRTKTSTLVRTKKPKLVRTKHKLVRKVKSTKLIKIKYLKSGRNFKSESGELAGTLLYANECRARVKMGSNKVKIHDIEFTRDKFLDISPDTMIYEV
jgi:hypothetical protein